MNEETLRKLKDQYREGMMVKLIEMKDKSAPPSGTFGTVKGVDDVGTVHVDWENGSTLGFIPGVDNVKVLASTDEYGYPIDIDEDLLARLRLKYQYGTRVVLLYFHDEADKLSIGWKGTVFGVDTRGFIIGRWDNGEEMFLDSELDEVQVLETKICPKCGKTYDGVSAISKEDGKTPICKACGYREELERLGIAKERIKEIVGKSESESPCQATR